VADNTSSAVFALAHVVTIMFYTIQTTTGVSLVGGGGGRGEGLLGGWRSLVDGTANTHPTITITTTDPHHHPQRPPPPHTPHRTHTPTVAGRG